jgi:hypothetical protein
MPFGKTRTAATYAKEILRHVSGSEIAGNSVVDGTQVPLNADGRRILETGTVMVYTGVNEKQTVAVTGAPDGGTFLLDPADGPVTDPIAFNASAAVVQTALEESLGAGNVLVTGPNGGPWVIEFTGTLSGRAIGDTTKNAGGLTGGTSPDITVTNTTVGGSAPAKGQKVIPAPSSGIASGAVAGIVMHTTEFWTDDDLTHADDEPLALWQKNCHFAADKLVGYSGNAAAVKAAMTGAGNDTCANCTFES